MTAPISKSQSCSRCGQPSPDDVLAGHCPRCLMDTSFGPGAIGGTSDEEPWLERLPRRFGDFELFEVLGRGGMGVVYRARQSSLNREVALKILPGGEFARPEFRRRFRAEALTAAQLHHPNIVPIYDAGEHEGLAFFTMELVEGRTLADAILGGPLPARKSAEYLQALAEAVHYAHSRGVLHRDLKPSNVLLDASDTPRLTDFGLARSLTGSSDLTLTGQALGSPEYMPPEQTRGKPQTLNAAADVYALGAILYHLVTGRPPFQGDAVHEVLWQVRQTDPIPPRKLNPSIPVDLETICLKCLEKEPARRYGSAAELAGELGRFLRGEPIQARPLGALERAARWCGRNRPLAGACLALALALAAGLGGILWQWRRAALSEHAARLNLYAADMRAASIMLAEGDLGQARRLLELHRPRDREEDLRGFEWRYLSRRCQGRQQAVLSAHESIVTAVAFSPDGRWAASGGQDGRVGVWDARDARWVTNFVAAGNPVWSVDFTPDARFLVAGGFKGRVQFWETARWTEAANFPGQLASVAGDFVAATDSSPFPEEHERAGPARVWNYQTGRLLWQSDEPGRRVALSPDGGLLALTLPGNSQGVQVREIPGGKLLRAWTTENRIWNIAFPPGADRLLTWGWSPRMTLWELNDPGGPRVLEGHSLAVWDARFSPDGLRFASASSDRTVRIWDAVSGEPIQVLQGHENEVWAVAFDPTGNRLVTGGKDRLVMLWDAAAANPALSLQNYSYARPFFSPDGRHLVHFVTTNQTRKSVVTRLADRSVSLMHEGQAHGFSPDGSELVWVAPDVSALRYVSISRPQPVRDLALESPAPAAPLAVFGFSSDWTFFFAIGSDGRAALWNTATGRQLANFTALPPPIRAAKLSPDGRLLAVSVERDYALHLFDARTGRVRKLPGHRDHIAGLAFSVDGQRLATGSVDGDIRIWDSQSGAELLTLTGHLQEATDVAFSPDGRTLASIGHWSAVKLWHLPTGREVVSLSRPQAGLFLEFARDGRHLAASMRDNSLEILEAP